MVFTVPEINHVFFSTVPKADLPFHHTSMIDLSRLIIDGYWLGSYGAINLFKISLQKSTPTEFDLISSIVSPHSLQLVWTVHPLLSKTSCVRILFCTASQRKILTLRGSARNYAVQIRSMHMI